MSRRHMGQISGMFLLFLKTQTHKCIWHLLPQNEDINILECKYLSQTKTGIFFLCIAGKNPIILP